MSISLHRLRALITRVLLFAGLAQIAAPGAAALREVACEAALAQRSSETQQHAPHPGDAHLSGAAEYAEIDEFDARRARPKIRRAVMSTELPKVFWEDSIRIRIEDRRNCRPPNSRV